MRFSIFSCQNDLINLIILAGEFLMFGFLKLGNKTALGGEVIRAKKRRKNLLQVLLFIIGFALLNLILYYLTNV